MMTTLYNAGLLTIEIYHFVHHKQLGALSKHRK